MAFRAPEKSGFKNLLLSKDYGLDDLIQMYITFKEFDDIFLWNNPFKEQLNAVFEVINERYPEAFS